jgi:succinate dehydrogenase/fumarate reductase flavoprotein subunit
MMKEAFDFVVIGGGGGGDAAAATAARRNIKTPVGEGAG